MKSKTKNLLITLVSLVAIIALVYVFAVNSNVGYIGAISEGKIVLQNENISIVYNGINFDLTSVKFANNYGGDGIYICGSHQVFISNSYSQSPQYLSISSSISSDKKDCDGNFIRASATFPKGTVNVGCDIHSAERKNDYAETYCIIKDGEKSLVELRAYNRGGGAENGETPNLNKSYQFIIDNPTTLTFEVVTNSGYTGSAYGTLNISFIPYVAPANETVTISENMSLNPEATPNNQELVKRFSTLDIVSAIIVLLVAVGAAVYYFKK